MGVNASVKKSFEHDAVECVGTGMIVDVFRHVRMIAWASDRLKISVKIYASCCAYALVWHQGQQRQNLSVSWNCCCKEEIAPFGPTFTESFTHLISGKYLGGMNNVGEGNGLVCFYNVCVDIFPSSKARNILVEFRKFLYWSD